MPPLVDDLLEEVLLRLPPHEPASLVRAAIVSRRWRRLVTDAGFRRRFREFHRSPPVLGMLCNRADPHVARFVPTTAFCSPEADRGHRRTLDARHGRVLLLGEGGDAIVVWDPITDEEQVLPFPPQYMCTLSWTAAVLCAAAAGAGACDHLDCHHRPFVVVLVGSVFKGHDAEVTFVCTYASEASAWSEPIYSEQPRYLVAPMGSAFVGNALYFMEFWGRRVLKYSLELQEISWILLPSSLPHPRGRQLVLIATENGELGLATKQGSKLCIWLRKQDACEVGDEWRKPSRAIKLKMLFPEDVALSKIDVVGSAEGVGIIFLRADDMVYTVDLKTHNVKKVYQGKINAIIPYMSFYTPVEHEISWILLPSSLPYSGLQSVLIATENGELGFASIHGSKLCIWLRKQDPCNNKLGHESRKPSRGRAIKLKSLLPDEVALSNLNVIGSAEGSGIIFLRADDVVYTIDVKTYKVKQVYKGNVNTIVPYMSFYTPALETACPGDEGPIVGGSSA